MRALAALWLGALFSLVGVGGCRPYPPRPIVDEVELEQVDELERGEAVDVDAILERLATVESPDLFGIFPRVLEYETYDPTVLARDLERIERAYRARGYYEAKVIAARVVHTDEHYVRVEIRVFQGDPVIVERVTPSGLGSMPLEQFAAMTEATKGLVIKQGVIFDEARFEADKSQIMRALRAKGFAFAKVEGRATVDIAKRSAVVTYQIDPGPPASYGSVSIVGLKEIPEGPVREALDVEEDRPFSSTDLEDAEVALMSLGVFSRVEIREDLQHRESGKVPLTVVVEESNLRTIRLGGGMRLDVLRLGFRLRAAWENRNFLGGLRRLSVEAQPGLTLFPTAIGNLTAPVAYLPEFRLNTALRQPSFLEGRTTGFIEGQYAFFPVLYPLPEDADADAEPVLGYHQVTTSTGVERSFWLHQLFVQPSYNFQAHFPFYYKDEPQPNVLGEIGSVLVSFPELVTRLEVDLERVRFVVANRLQVAGYAFGGDVSDVRFQPELLTFVPLSRRTELALRVGFGFLFPSGYGSVYDTSFDPYSTEPTENTPRNVPTSRDVIEDQQKMLFRAFYSGGPTSNRGYPFRGVGPHGPVGFLLPNASAAVNCGDVTEAQWQQRCMRPLGGMTLWEVSLEARFPIVGDVGGVVFVDASDLTPYRLDSGQEGTFRLNVPHLSPGIGLRYATPVGPLRLDLAYRFPGAQEMGERYLSPQYGSPTGDESENLFNSYYLPLSLNFAIGEAFD